MAITRPSKTPQKNVESMTRVAWCALLVLVDVEAFRPVLFRPVPMRSRVVRMESEAAYRRRMAERRDASKSDEWNSAYAKLEKVVPVRAFGRAIGEVDVELLRAAITDAAKAGVEYAELEEFDKILQDEVKRTDPTAKVEEDATVRKAKEEAQRSQEKADKKVIEADNARQTKLQAFAEMNRAKPTLLFGRIMGEFDLAGFRAKIDRAKKSGVDEDDISAAEELYAAALKAKGSKK